MGESGSVNLPENTVPDFINFPGTKNSNVTCYRSLHQVRLVVELSGFARLAMLHHFSRSVHTNGNSSVLKEGILIGNQVRNLYSYNVSLFVIDLRTPVGVKKAGIPAPPALNRSANVP